ncbi:MAG: DUF5004 domain-containing protein [Saprospiraceae bacterium]|nr:DUF5004 domain-containing protein [Saprospiraceae bacterium]
MPFFVSGGSKTTLLWFALLYGLGMTSCEDQSVTIPEGALQEHTVDLSGQWHVVQVTLNGTDITTVYDFEQIRLTLNMDQLPTDFEIETGTAPFPVVENGQWYYNDPAYPTSISFTADNHQRSVDFAAPPISGDSSFKISFTLGCPDNVYTYTFNKQ